MRPLAMLTAAAAFGMLATGCSHETDHAEATANTAPAPIAVAVAPATIETVERTVDLVGAFYANEEVKVAAQIEARVASFGPDVGDRVEEGAVLVQLDDADLQASLREIQARLTKARADNSRAQVLRTQGIMSTEEAEKIRTEAAVLEAQLDVVKVKIDRTVIRAPFTGVIAARSTSVGAVVKSGETLYELVQDHPLKFRTPIPERFAGLVQIGQELRLGVDAYPGRIFTGKITRITPTSAISNRSLTIEAVVPNGDHTLLPGFFSKGQLVVNTHGEAVFVPANALTTFAGVSKLFVVVDGGKVEERIVQTGVALGDRREVADGVKAGEQVATTNLDKLEQGTPVIVTP